ncbi:MAG: glycosyltransferase [Bacteroidetes bacterium]|nr:glycosyltransferase [Bacteroidota bacterium]
MKKVLIITYYWPPSGGSGVQRWMFFCKYLAEFNIKPIVLTVDEKKASYRFFDQSFLKNTEGIEVYKTNTIEPLQFYSYLLSGNKKEGIPQGFAGENEPGVFQKASRFLRGNLFIPDARIGWNSFAYKKALEIIEREKIDIVITTGPPHSTHLIGLKLKKKLGLNWIADFRDPWTELYYNRFLYRTGWAKRKDATLEEKVLEKADKVISVGPTLTRMLQDKVNANKDKFHVIFNGYDHKMFESLKPQKDKERFTILHLGVLGESQPILPFLEAIKKLMKEIPSSPEKIKLLLVGNVSPFYAKEIELVIPEIDFEIRKYIPHRDAIQLMLNAELLLNSLAEAENSKMLISGKLMEYVATGNPVLALGDTEGDSAFVLREIEQAEVYSRKDMEGIYGFLKGVFEKWDNGKLEQKTPIGIMKYSRKETTRELSEIIKSFGL